VTPNTGIEEYRKEIQGAVAKNAKFDNGIKDLDDFWGAFSGSCSSHFRELFSVDNSPVMS
jgi:hypothetical protein